MEGFGVEHSGSAVKVSSLQNCKMNKTEAD
jgi:hypothetical protein